MGGIWEDEAQHFSQIAEHQNFLESFPVWLVGWLSFLISEILFYLGRDNFKNCQVLLACNQLPLE